MEPIEDFLQAIQDDPEIVLHMMRVANSVVRKRARYAAMKVEKPATPRRYVHAVSLEKRVIIGKWALELRAQGFTWARISEECGYSPRSVRKWSQDLSSAQPENADTMRESSHHPSKEEADGSSVAVSSGNCSQEISGLAETARSNWRNTYACCGVGIGYCDHLGNSTSD